MNSSPRRSSPSRRNSVIRQSKLKQNGGSSPLRTRRRHSSPSPQEKLVTMSNGYFQQSYSPKNDIENEYGYSPINIAVKKYLELPMSERTKIINVLSNTNEDNMILRGRVAELLTAQLQELCDDTIY